MSDGLPLVIAGPIGLALSGAIGALWADRKSVRDQARNDCKEQIHKLEERLAKLEKSEATWRDRWVLEVQRNVELASMPSDGRPRMPPPPDWDERSEVRNDRELITREALRQYVQGSSPPEPPRPRPKMPSRPR